MMKVKHLISALKKMPQNAEVGYAHGDNYEYEVAGWCNSVARMDKIDHLNTKMTADERQCLESLPDTVVVIRD